VSHPAAWHADPTGKHDHRWWDGERWTEHVADAGQASVDPIEDAPPPPGGTTAPGTDSGPTGGLAGGEQPSQGWQGGEEPSQGWQGGEQDQGWQQPGPAWQSEPGPGQQGWQGGQQQGGQQQGWQGGSAPVWDQPGGGGAPAWQGGGGQARGTDGVAVAAMIVGILALLVSWIPILGAIGGIVALVLGLVGRSRIKKSGAGGNGMAVTGIATGAVAIVINIAIIAFFVFAGDGFFEEFGSYVECVEETGDEARCQEQLEEGLFDRFGQ
jgi:hypothetical protein